MERYPVLTARIHDFFEEHEFVLDNGYYVANNLYYIDKVESKGRELYIRALKQK